MISLILIILIIFLILAQINVYFSIIYSNKYECFVIAYINHRLVEEIDGIYHEKKVVVIKLPKFFNVLKK